MRRLVVLAFVVFLGSCSRDGADSPTKPSAPVQPEVPASSTAEVTFTADASACANLPSELRTRSFLVNTDSYIWDLQRATFLPTGSYGKWNRVYVSSTYIGFNDPPIWESIGPDGYLVIYGQAEGQALLTRSPAPFWARFEYCPSREPDDYPECKAPVITCESTNHQLLIHWR
jgi:hypothetical protein